MMGMFASSLMRFQAESGDIWLSGVSGIYWANEQMSVDLPLRFLLKEDLRSIKKFRVLNEVAQLMTPANLSDQKKIYEVLTTLK